MLRSADSDWNSVIRSDISIGNRLTNRNIRAMRKNRRMVGSKELATLGKKLRTKETLLPRTITKSKRFHPSRKYPRLPRTKILATHSTLNCGSHIDVMGEWVNGCVKMCEGGKWME